MLRFFLFEIFVVFELYMPSVPNDEMPAKCTRNLRAFCQQAWSPGHCPASTECLLSRPKHDLTVPFPPTTVENFDNEHRVAFDVFWWLPRDTRVCVFTSRKKCEISSAKLTTGDFETSMGYPGNLAPQTLQPASRYLPTDVLRKERRLTGKERGKSSR